MQVDTCNVLSSRHFLPSRPLFLFFLLLTPVWFEPPQMRPRTREVVSPTTDGLKTFMLKLSTRRETSKLPQASAHGRECFHFLFPGEET